MVVAHVDDDALASLVLDVEVEVELGEVVVAHGRDVDVAEFAVGDFFYVGAAVGYPGAVEEAGLDLQCDRAEDYVVLLAGGLEGEDGALAGAVV